MNTFPIQLFTKKNCPSHGTPVYSLYIIVFSGSKYSNVNTQYRQNDTSQWKGCKLADKSHPNKHY